MDKKEYAFTPLEAGHRRCPTAAYGSLLLMGFTLIELILVVVIVTTLALIAIPNFAKSKYRAMEKEAIANLKLIAAAELIYKMEQGSYVECSCTDATNCTKPAGCNALLKLMLNTTNWRYAVSTNAQFGSAGAYADAQPSTGMGGGNPCQYFVPESQYSNPQPSPSTSTGCP